MPLWGNIDYPSGNQKPLFANTSNVSSNSTINDTAANTDQYYGLVMGVSPTEMTTAEGQPYRPQSSGWVSLKIGTGPITTVSISDPGSGINSSGFIVITDTATDTTSDIVGTVGSGANISYTIANTQNTLQAYSTNSAWNGINTLTVVNGGSGYSNVSRIIYTVSGSNTTQPTLSITLGGRAGRFRTETLVAMGSITGDAQDNQYFSGV
jgi:hypothetical protein